MFKISRKQTVAISCKGLIVFMHVNEMTYTSGVFSTVNQCAGFIGGMHLSHGGWHMITHAYDPSFVNSNAKLQMTEL